MDMNLDEKNSVLFLKPAGALTTEDFIQLSSVIDSYLKDHEELKGMMVETQRFPGWANIHAFIAHVKFIKNHHMKIRKVALVTDSTFAEIGKLFIGPFVSPKIMHFPYDQAELAKQWIMQ